MIKPGENQKLPKLSNIQISSTYKDFHFKSIKYERHGSLWTCYQIEGEFYDALLNTLNIMSSCTHRPLALELCCVFGHHFGHEFRPHPGEVKEKHEPVDLVTLPLYQVVIHQVEGPEQSHHVQFTFVNFGWRKSKKILALNLRPTRLDVTSVT